MSTATIDIAAPCPDPEHMAPRRRSYQGIYANLRVNGKRVGIELPICRGCYKRRYSRLVRAGTLPGRDKWPSEQTVGYLHPRPPCRTPVVHLPTPDLSPGGEEDLDQMTPAEISRLIRAIWNTPAASTVLMGQRAMVETDEND